MNLTRLESALRNASPRAFVTRMDSARDRSKGKLEWKVRTAGQPSEGKMASDSPLLAALRAADEVVGNPSRASLGAFS